MKNYQLYRKNTLKSLLCQCGIYIGNLGTLFLLVLSDFFYFRVRILGLDNLRDIPDLDVIYVDVGVFHGGEELCTILSTHEIPAAKYPRWNEWLVFNISVRNLPKVMLCLSLVCF